MRQLIVIIATMVDTVACWRWGTFELGLVVVAAGGWAASRYDPNLRRAHG